MSHQEPAQVRRNVHGAGAALRAEIERLRRENALLRQRLSASTPPPGRGDAETVTRDLSLLRVLQKGLNAKPIESDVAPILLFIKDSEHRFAHFVNRPLADLYGTTPSRMYGLQDKDFNGNADQVRDFWNDDQWVLDHGGPLYRREPVNDHQGRTHHYHTVKLRIVLGRRRHVLGVAVEVTTLEEERSLQEQIMDTLPGGVFVKDLKHRFTYANRKQCEFLNRPSFDRLKGKTDRDFSFPRKLAEDLIKEEQGVLRRGEVVSNKEREFLDREGRRQVRLVTKVPRRDAGGKIIGLVGISRDITEFVRAREEIQGQLRKMHREQSALRGMLQQVLDAIPQCIFWKDRDLVYQGCNANFAARHGKSHPSEIIDQNDFDLSPQEDAVRFQTLDKEVLRTGRPRKHIPEIIDRPGEPKTIYETCKYPLRGPDGKIIGILGVVEDITERNRAYQQLVGHIGHDFLTRIVGLRGWLSVLDKPPITQEEIRNIKRAVHLLKRNAERIGSFSVLQRSEPLKPVSLRMLLTPLSAIWNDRRLDIRRPSRDIVVLSEASCLEDAVVELIGNARRHAPPAARGGWVRVWAQSRGGRGQIHVADNGPGLPPGELGSEYYIPSTDTKRSGLGHVLVALSLHRAGGRARQIGAVGPGAHFVIDLSLRSASHRRHA